MCVIDIVVKFSPEIGRPERGHWPHGLPKTNRQQRKLGKPGNIYKEDANTGVDLQALSESPQVVLSSFADFCFPHTDACLSKFDEMGFDDSGPDGSTSVHIGNCQQRLQSRHT